MNTKSGACSDSTINMSSSLSVCCGIQGFGTGGGFTSSSSQLCQLATGDDRSTFSCMAGVGFPTSIFCGADTYGDATVISDAASSKTNSLSLSYSSFSPTFLNSASSFCTSIC